MSRKSIVLTILLVILLLASLVGNVLLFLNSRSLTDQLNKQNGDIASLQQQVSDLSKPVSSPVASNSVNPMEDNSAEYNYVYDLIKDVYTWDGLPTKSTLQVFKLGAGVGATVDSYTLTTVQLDSSVDLGASINIPDSAIGKVLIANGWVFNDQSIADGVDGASAQFTKGDKTLSIGFTRPFGDRTDHKLTINFQANK